MELLLAFERVSLSDLSHEWIGGASKGLLIDGLVALGSGADEVDVSAGSGYLQFQISGENTIKYVEWDAATLDTTTSTPLLVDDNNNYVSVDENGLLQVSATRPDDIAQILLGRAFLGNGGNWSGGELILVRLQIGYTGH